MSDKPRVPS